MEYKIVDPLLFDSTPIVIPKVTFQLRRIKKSYPQLKIDMSQHYSQPKGFVGRSLCYAIIVNEIWYYGSIIGGSTPAHLPGRYKIWGYKYNLNSIINNIFFHLRKTSDGYPIRNFGQCVLQVFRQQCASDWKKIYGDDVIGFESLVELPRTGEIYLRDKWTLIGQTIGYTCKRTAGYGTDSWTGKRVWDTKNLRPKLVFAKKI